MHCVICNRAGFFVRFVKGVALTRDSRGERKRIFSERIVTVRQLSEREATCIASRSPGEKQEQDAIVLIKEIVIDR